MSRAKRAALLGTLAATAVGGYAVLSNDSDPGDVPSANVIDDGANVARIGSLIKLEGPTGMFINSLSEERTTGRLAPMGEPLEGGAISDVDFAAGEDSFTFTVEFEVPQDPWFLTVSLAADDELVLEGSVVDGGNEVNSDFVVFGDAADDPPGALRFVDGEVSFDLEVDQTSGAARFDFPQTLSVPSDLAINRGGEFDVYLTFGSTPVGDSEPEVHRFGAGQIDLALDRLTTDQEEDLITLVEVRRDGLRGAPDGVADCIVQTVSYADELLGFLSGTLDTLAVPCFFSATPIGAAVTGGLEDFAGNDPETLTCIGNGLALRAATTADVASLVQPPAQWPGGLLEKYAAVLEDCVPLRPFYLNRFGAFSYTKSGCPELMTDYVLGRYSWERFITEGIIDQSPTVRDAAKGRFEQDVNSGYGVNECFAN